MDDLRYLQAIGRNLQTARLGLGLTQECLAELVGIHWKTLGNIERGKYPFSVATFARLCQHLEISPAKLLEGIPVPDARRAGRIKKALARKRRASGV